MTKLQPHVRSAKSKATVLVVDDSAEMRTYYRNLLELQAYRVATACNGVEALESIEAGLNPDVVLLDLEMPVLDGMVTLQHLRTLSPTMKIIICSGVADPEKAQMARNLGAAAYLTKPVRFLYLTAALERCLDNRNAAQVEPSEPSVLEFPSTGA